MPTVHVFARDHINTDEIIPARHLTTDVESELAKYAMEDYDKDFVRRVQPGDIIVAGADFGCGSSREHAVWALKDYGFRVVTVLKMGCPLTLDATVSDGGEQLYESCAEWTPEALAALGFALR